MIAQCLAKQCQELRTALAKSLKTVYWAWLARGGQIRNAVFEGGAWREAGEGAGKG
jgi:hypothetical protein